MTTTRPFFGLAMRLRDAVGLTKSQALRLLPIILNQPAALLAAIERSEADGEAKTTTIIRSAFQPG